MREGRMLGRAATLVALLTSPALFFLLYGTHAWQLPWALVGTLAAIVIFRGGVDVIAHKLIPSPALYGAEDARARRRLAPARLVLAPQAQGVVLGRRDRPDRPQHRRGVQRRGPGRPRSPASSRSGSPARSSRRRAASASTPNARDELARITNGYSPAMIDQACSPALTYAHSGGRMEFRRRDLVEAMTTVESGVAIGRAYPKHEERVTAIHEAGHAVCGHVRMDKRVSTRLSIRKRGSGPHGSIKDGTPSKSRLQLVRREALELALYTFRYLPEVELVVTLLPPPPPEKGTEAAASAATGLASAAANPDELGTVFVRPGDLKPQLQVPLGPKAPAPEKMGGLQGKTVDSLTLANVFTWSLTRSQDSTPYLVLDREP